MFPDSSLSVGSHTIAATYNSDENYTTNTATPVTQVVNSSTLPATFTELVSSANPSVLQSLVTFTAFVTSQASGIPTGTVTFSIDGTPQTPVPLVDTAGPDFAQFSISSLTLGNHTIAATYNGDSSFAMSTATPLTQMVNASALPATTTTLASSLNPSTFGDTVTFTATVTSQTAGTPTGSVMFLDGQTLIGTEPLAVVAGEDVATLPTSALTGGTHIITAVYSGDDNFAPSVTTTPVNQVVTQAATNVSLETSLSPSTYGQSVTFTAEITSAVSGTPTGTVIFSVDGTRSNRPSRSWSSAA